MKPFGILIIRSAIFGFAYTVATTLYGALLNYVVGNISIPGSQSPFILLSTACASGFLIGLTCGSLTKFVSATRSKRFFTWTCIIFLNIASVIIEGAFFAPGQLPIALIPRILFQYFLLALTSSLLVLLLFPAKTEGVQKANMPHRSFLSWSFAFLVSAFSYLLFYFVFGTLNYELFTKTYYQSHGGLAVPEFKTVFEVEAIRSVFIILSIVPLLTAMKTSKKNQMLICGLTLFIVGGIIPLLMQVGSLPTNLLFASGIEIFFQNFLTGFVATLMLGSYRTTTVKKSNHLAQT